MMQPVYRHVVPNVPALAAGNGKPVYRGDAPSRRRTVKFSVEFIGNLDVQPFVDYFSGYDFSGAVDLSVSASEINAAFAAASDIDDTGAYGSLDLETGDGELPEHDYFVACGIRGGLYDVSAKALTNWGIRVGVEWDAAVAGWRWIGRLYDWTSPSYSGSVTFRDSYGAQVGRIMELGRARGQHAGYAFYASSLTTQSIRAGAAGVVLPFRQMFGADEWNTWRAGVLAGTSLKITASAA